MNKEVVEFVIYIINEIANRKKYLSISNLQSVTKTDCINGYLAPLYYVLHTMSSASVVNDVIKYTKERGQML